MTLLEARRTIYARQGLGLLPSKDDAMAAMVAVQTQYAQSLNQALCARSVAPEPNYESTGLVADGYLVKSWTLRGTVHTHARDDLNLVLSAVGPWLYPRFRAMLRPHHGMTDAEYESMELAVLDALAEGPLTRSELHQRVPDLARMPWTGWGSDVKGLAYLGKLSFIGVGAEQRFALLSGYEPIPDARDELARRFFRRYGPATIQDFAYWVGTTAREASAILKRIRPELTEVTIEGMPGVRFTLGETPDVEPRKATLLAKFDPLTLAYRDKSLLFPAEHHSRIYRIAAQIEAVFLLGGEAAGTWRMARKGTRLEVALEPWRRLYKHEIQSLEREAARLAQSLDLRQATVVNSE